MEPSPAPEGRRERKKRETRERILQVAQAQFNRHGFEATTVEAIAEQADISKPTLFNYFPSKLSILQALLPEVDERFAEVIEATAQTSAVTGKRLEAFFNYVASMTEATPHLTRSLMLQSLQVYGSTEPSEGPSDLRRFPATRNALQNLLEAGIQRGEVRSDARPEQLTEYVTGIYVHQFMTWLIDPNYPLHRELVAAATFLTAALRPAPPA
ncbi:helix-turn-helix transcriptional regulator [Parahaliea maris]|uniref:Helix-turn-helix transcriptional regulator n=1 Tax=Parahaliea maris TaxID=2716870 RepID=A0A5C9A035_9GAMM|nr:TetR/AcrR family transcriptional regulator [Parahaliea maris]TXS92781.1 helix-turn-helix transcriptional regulator [Parahaliea maris]